MCEEVIVCFHIKNISNLIILLRFYYCWNKDYLIAIIIKILFINNLFVIFWLEKTLGQEKGRSLLYSIVQFVGWWSYRIFLVNTNFNVFFFFIQITKSTKDNMRTQVKTTVINKATKTDSRQTKGYSWGSCSCS